MIFKSRASYTGATSEGKNAKFLAINHEAISKESAAKKVVKFTILRPLSAGFASAPYKLKSPKRDPDAQPLSELKHEGRPVMVMHSFKKQGAPGNKGPRSDLNWTLQTGNTIKLWLDEERAKDAELLVGDVEAFSVCEISVASKNEDSVRGGWCFKITAVRPADFSLHSMIPDLQSLCSNLGEARTREAQALSAQPLLQKELETQSVAFWTPVRREAVLDEAGGTVKIVNWGENFHVELPTEALLAATNCKRVDWACALLEVAIAAGATSMLVIANDFWKGGPRGVVTICAETLFGSIREPGIHETPFKTEFDGEEAYYEIEIGSDTLCVPGSRPPPCDDFEFTGLDTELACAHTVQFNLRARGEVIPAVWKGYYNAGPTTRAAPVLAKRKRTQTMDE
jgi:hypothetical protein